MGASISLGGSECFPNLASPTELRLTAAEVNKRDEDNALFERGLPPWWAEPIGDVSSHSAEASQDVGGQPSTPTAEKVGPHNSVVAHAMDGSSIGYLGTEPAIAARDLKVEKATENLEDRSLREPQVLPAVATAPTPGIASAVPTNTVPGFHPKTFSSATAALPKHSPGLEPTSDLWIGSAPPPVASRVQRDGSIKGSSSSGNNSGKRCSNGSGSNSAIRADLLRLEAASAKGNAEARTSFLSLLEQGGLGHRSRTLLEIGVESVEDARDPVRSQLVVLLIRACCTYFFGPAYTFFPARNIKHVRNSY